MDTLGISMLILGLILLLVGIILLALYAPKYLSGDGESITLYLVIGGGLMLVIGLGLSGWAGWRLWKNRGKTAGPSPQDYAMYMARMQQMQQAPQMYTAMPTY